LIEPPPRRFAPPHQARRGDRSDFNKFEWPSDHCCDTLDEHLQSSAVVVREGKNLKGKALGLVLGTVGESVLEKAFPNTVKAIEVRNGQEVKHASQTPT
jgi:hypothetical protein